MNIVIWLFALEPYLFHDLMYCHLETLFFLKHNYWKKKKKDPFIHYWIALKPWIPSGICQCRGFYWHWFLVLHAWIANSHGLPSVFFFPPSPLPISHIGFSASSMTGHFFCLVSYFQIFTHHEWSETHSVSTTCVQQNACMVFHWLDVGRHGYTEEWGSCESYDVTQNDQSWQPCGLIVLFFYSE